MKLFLYLSHQQLNRGYTLKNKQLNGYQIHKRKDMKIIKRILTVLSALFCLINCHCKVMRMPIYVTPWYNSDPFTIQVGKFSEMLKTNDVEALQNVADKIRVEIDKIPIETLYVLAIRFYDLGQKEDAMYWFYTAQFRRNIYARMVENVGGIGDAAFELLQAQSVFNKLSGKWINGYAGGVPDKWIEVVTKVSKEGVKSGYIGLTYPKLTFKPEIEQVAVVKEIAGEFAKLIQYIVDNREEIAQLRKENGIDGKY